MKTQPNILLHIFSNIMHICVIVKGRSIQTCGLVGGGGGGGEGGTK